MLVPHIGLNWSPTRSLHGYSTHLLMGIIPSERFFSSVGYNPVTYSLDFNYASFSDFKFATSTLDAHRGIPAFPKLPPTSTLKFESEIPLTNEFTLLFAIRPVIIDNFNPSVTKVPKFTLSIPELGFFVTVDNEPVDNEPLKKIAVINQLHTYYLTGFLSKNNWNWVALSSVRKTRRLHTFPLTVKPPSITQSTTIDFDAVEYEGPITLEIKYERNSAPNDDPPVEPYDSTLLGPVFLLNKDLSYVETSNLISIIQPENHKLFNQAEGTNLLFLSFAANELTVSTDHFLLDQIKFDAYIDCNIESSTIAYLDQWFAADASLNVEVTTDIQHSPDTEFYNFVTGSLPFILVPTNYTHEVNISADVLHDFYPTIEFDNIIYVPTENPIELDYMYAPMLRIPIHMQLTVTFTSFRMGTVSVPIVLKQASWLSISSAEERARFARDPNKIIVFPYYKSR
jgi:hypothetical protein